MKISVVHLTSDSSDNEDVDKSIVNGSKYTCEKSSTLQSAQKFFCENQKSDAKQRAPLFKIIFRDESTSRIYRKKLADIIKYLVSAKLCEDSESNSRDLVLEFYEPIENVSTTINADTTADLNGTPVIDNNQNYNLDFDFEKEMKMEAMAKCDINSQNNDALSTKSFNLYQPVNTFDTFNWEIQQCPQPQELQQPNFCSRDNLNVRKRKWVDDSDSTVLKKKKRIECASEYLSHLQYESDTLKDAETNVSKKPSYASVWSNSNNNQSKVTESIENHQSNASNTPYYSPVWTNSSNKLSTISESIENSERNSLWTPDYDPVQSNSSDKQITVAKRTPLEKIKDSSSKAQATSSLDMKIMSSTFTYRVLKVGTFDYTTKRTFLISKDGIQLCAHHLSKASTLVKVNIKLANLLKIEASFSQILPALLLYVNETAAMIVKEALGMNNDSTAYLDPQSTDENCNKIIILPDHMPENCRVLKNLVKLGLINKLDKESADTIIRNSFSKSLVRRSLLNKELPNKLFLNITSHCVRVGTYKCSKMKFNVMISIQGFQFQIPKVGNDKFYKQITIDFTEIKKLYFSLKKVSAFFLHVNSYCAQRIRLLIEMSETDTKKLYFDPKSETIAEQRLVIVFNKIKPYQEETLKHLLSYTQSAEISLDKIIHQMLFNHM